MPELPMCIFPSHKPTVVYHLESDHERISHPRHVLVDLRAVLAWLRVPCESSVRRSFVELLDVRTDLWNSNCDAQRGVRRSIGLENEPGLDGCFCLDLHAHVRLLPPERIHRHHNPNFQ